jgi:hypothetical protein
VEAEHERRFIAGDDDKVGSVAGLPTRGNLASGHRLNWFAERRRQCHVVRSVRWIGLKV